MTSPRHPDLAFNLDFIYLTLCAVFLTVRVMGNLIGTTKNSDF